MVAFNFVGKLFQNWLALNLAHLTPRKELTLDKWRSLVNLVLCVWISLLRVKKFVNIVGNFSLQESPSSDNGTKEHDLSVITRQAACMQHIVSLASELMWWWLVSPGRSIWPRLCCRRLVTFDRHFTLLLLRRAAAFARWFDPGYSHALSVARWRRVALVQNGILLLNCWPDLTTDVLPAGDNYSTECTNRSCR